MDMKRECMISPCKNVLTAKAAFEGGRMMSAGTPAAALSFP
jgi:hypothetical protein